MSRQTDIKTRLQKLDNYDFEHLIADLWTDQGWETRVLQASNDRGIDVEARRADPFEQKHLIQAKRYSEGNNVGSEEVQQYSSLQHQKENVDAVVIVTTSGFTHQAKDVAADLNLKLINGDNLAQIIREQDALDIVDKYASSADTGPSQNTDNASSNKQSLHTLNPNKLPEIYIKKLADNAEGNLVTKNRLTKLKPGVTHSQTLTSQPIIGHLYKDEQPHFTFRCPKIRLPTQEPIKPANAAYLVVTNQRILILIGDEEGDDELTISFRQVNDVAAGGLGNNKIELATEVGRFRFKIEHMVFNESQISRQKDIHQEMKNCVQFIEEAVYSLM